MIPTVISGHGNGILLHDQGSSDTPLTPLLKINTHQLFVLPLSLSPLALSPNCFAWGNLNVFDKGKRRGIYFLTFAKDAAIPRASYRGQCGSKLRLETFLHL